MEANHILVKEIHLPPIQNAYYTNQKQRNYGVCSLMFVDSFNDKYSNNRREGNGHLDSFKIMSISSMKIEHYEIYH